MTPPADPASARRRLREALEEEAGCKCRALYCRHTSAAIDAAWALLAATPEPAPALPEEPLPLTGIATLYDVCTLREIAEALHARGERNRPNYLLSLALRIERALAARKGGA